MEQFLIALSLVVPWTEKLRWERRWKRGNGHMKEGTCDDCKATPVMTAKSHHTHKKNIFCKQPFPASKYNWINIVFPHCDASSKETCHEEACSCHENSSHENASRWKAWSKYKLVLMRGLVAIVLCLLTCLQISWNNYMLLWIDLRVILGFWTNTCCFGWPWYFSWQKWNMRWTALTTPAAKPAAKPAAGPDSDYTEELPGRDDLPKGADTY